MIQTPLCPSFTYSQVSLVLLQSCLRSLLRPSLALSPCEFVTYMQALIHESEMGGFCRVGRDEEGSSSNRVEHVAAYIAVEDAIRYVRSQKPLTLLMMIVFIITLGDIM